MTESQLPATEEKIEYATPMTVVPSVPSYQVPATASFSTTNQETEMSHFVPMDHDDFDNYIREQPSTSSNVYEPPVNQMIVQQYAHEFASNVHIPEHSYVSFSFFFSIQILIPTSIIPFIG